MQTCRSSRRKGNRSHDDGKVMKVEHLPLPGGLKVFNDDGVETICRLSETGETRISRFGGDYDYDPAGNLVFATVRLADFIWTREEDGEEIPQDISDFAVFLGGKMGEEIVIKIDLSAMTMDIARTMEETSFEQGRYLLSPNGRTISMAAGIDGRDVVEVYFMAKVYSEGEVLGFGVRGVESRETVVVSVPLIVDPELLDGDLAGELGLAKINSFMTGGRS